MDKQILVVYSTISSQIEGLELAKKAIEDSIVGCVNIIPSITSVYKWQDNIEQATECGLLFKTTKQNKTSLLNWIKKNHPYDVPAIICANADTIPDFAKYIQENTKAHENN
ncbi:MAG: divalent-cation tolerance protein CutA [Legionellaceae bacterium]|nr:divalent-cation tolerance protein CutA [Legionellaceae bacterium]